MRLRRWCVAVLIVAAAAMHGVAIAQGCATEPPPATEAERPDHHPVGRGLPRAAGYRQPDACTDAFWFFDEDRDGFPAPAEPRVFGPQRTIVCASCHTESPPADSAAARSVFLRQDASRLCLVCHVL